MHLAPAPHQGPDIRHDLGEAIQKTATVPEFRLTPPTRAFIEYLDTYGPSRYLDVEQWGAADRIFELDRAVWELRRFCTTDPKPRQLEESNPVPRVQLPGGHLEKIIDGNRKRAARAALVWQNAFFGPRIRHTVRVPTWERWTNPPLGLQPEMVEEVAQYVKVSKELKAYWRQRAAARGLVGP